MSPKKEQSEIDRVRATNLFLKLVLSGCVAVALLLALTAYRLAGAEKVIVTPPGFDRAFWVSGERVSKEYLERWAYYVATIGLNVSPRNVDYQCGVMIDLSSRDAAQPIKEACEKNAVKIKRDGIRTTFDPVGSMQIDEEHLRINLPGVLTTYYGDKRTSDVNKAYAIWFKLTPQGRIKLDFFREVIGDDPFGVKAVGARAAGGN